MASGAQHIVDSCSTVLTSTDSVQASVRDDILDVVVDPDDFNEYMVFKEATPKLKKFKFTRRKFDDSEVAAAGLLAGTVVEVVRVIVMHPLDTIRTRQQSVQALELEAVGISSLLNDVVNATFSTLDNGTMASDDGNAAPAAATPSPPPREGRRGNLTRMPATLIFDKPWQGLRTALLTSVPQGAVFWAVKDVVRREMLARLAVTTGQGTIFLQYFTPQYSSPPNLPAWLVAAGLDWRAVATITAVTAGEIAYWLARAPSEVAKTRAQVSAINPMTGGDEHRGNEQERTPSQPVAQSSSQSPVASALSAALSVFEAFPILALTDLPVVVLRVYFFLLLKAWGGASLLAIDSALTSDIVLYIVASLAANGLATPLEVVRTRLLLQRSGGAAGAARYSGILDALATIYQEEGAEALFRGLQVRLLWNGLWLGVILGMQRTAYVDVQSFFLGFVEAVEDAAGSEWQQWLLFLTPTLTP